MGRISRPFRNEIIVLLHKKKPEGLGFSYYAICKAFNLGDKRNFIDIFEKHKDEFSLSKENK